MNVTVADGTTAVAAVDLGASSGRVMLGRVAPDRLDLVEVNRFPNLPVRVAGTLHWDILALYRGVLEGLRAAGREAGRITSVGIDSWAVDYGLLDAEGTLLGNPVHYRDERTDGAMDKVFASVPAEEIYRITGLQFLPFNTIYQLAASAGSPQLAAARNLLLVPDLLSYWLTGIAGTEVTNASTTQLLDVRTRTWSDRLLTAAGVSADLFPPLRQPGDPAGELLPDVLDETGLVGPVPVTAVGSHDTASAVVGVPAAGERFAYVSCGTWSLVGVELDSPVLTEESRRANFSNEGGVDGTTRYLRNVMGLWLLQESIHAWNAAGLPADLASLLHDAARVPAFSAVVDVDDPAFLPPGDMPARIAAACRRTGQTPPQSQAETVRCILDSLALAYRAAVHDAVRLSGRDVDAVHIVGGGARNGLLCQLTADACRRPVVAGPVEAAALGNVLVQARAAGVVHRDLRVLRQLLRNTQQLTVYEPQGTDEPWRAAAARIGR
ncbi:rhamnulokinase [Micromonospora rhizosphaerae]|uniref:Rhamnulokinase n=1 Tax=Micromonospora rhizosphaerae TaxID=568872 RepID=A0A1C6SA95_9ACTN|nr:rhamnulokinase family protein [Micromonospora rhizosphaerae]SCL26395.1 rhamnulokinase [Micromonospora rhizosphaerae]